LTLLAMDQQYI